MAGEYSQGFALGASLGTQVADSVQKGIAEYRSIRKERQQRAELDQAAKQLQASIEASHSEVLPGEVEAKELERILTTYGEEGIDIAQIQEGIDPETGEPIQETYITTPEGDIPTRVLQRVGMQNRAAKRKKTQAFFDASMEIISRYPDNPLVNNMINNQLTLRATQQAEEAANATRVQAQMERARAERERQINEALASVGARDIAQLNSILIRSGQEALPPDADSAEVQQAVQSIDPTAVQHYQQERAAELTTQAVDRSEAALERGFTLPKGPQPILGQSISPSDRIAARRLQLEEEERTVAVPVTDSEFFEGRARSNKAAESLRDTVPTRRRAIRILRELKEWRDSYETSQFLDREQIQRVKALAEELKPMIGTVIFKGALQKGELDILKEFLPTDVASIKPTWLGDSRAAIVDTALESQQDQLIRDLRQNLTGESYNRYVRAVREGGGEELGAGRFESDPLEEYQRRQQGGPAELADREERVPSLEEAIERNVEAEGRREEGEEAEAETDEQRELVEKLRREEGRMLQAMVGLGSGRSSRDRKRFEIIRRAFLADMEKYQELTGNPYRIQNKDLRERMGR